MRYRFRDEFELKLTEKRVAPDEIESEASGAVYMNEDTLTDGASSDRTRNWNDDDADHDQPRSTGLRPALTWKNTDSWKRFLLRYFSDNIAPEMVLIDDSHNGWRHLILPLAWMDELVMKAVLAVSAFHLSGKTDGYAPCQGLANSSELYSEAIHELQNRKNLDQYDHQTKRRVILSIIVLLVAVMVTGCSDFPILFHLLQSALDTIGGEDELGPDELSEFALRQIHKMRVYAAPFISQQAGVYTILSQAPHSFDCLYYSSRFHPEKQCTIDLIASLRQQAYDIYLQRVMLNQTPGNELSSADVVRKFRASLESFPKGFPGDHSLVWASFIAASESYTPDNQQFFEQFLLRQYHRNGFGNILKGLELLKRIWARDVNWPALLPEPQVFIM